MKTTVLATIITIALLISSTQAFSQTNTTSMSKKDVDRIAKVKRDLGDIGVGNTITVSRIDNRDFFGRVKTIGSDDFEVVETDSKQIQLFKYEDIKNVRSGDGTIMATGVRKNRRYRWLYPIAFAGGLLIIAVIGLKER